MNGRIKAGLRHVPKPRFVFFQKDQSQTFSVSSVRISLSAPGASSVTYVSPETGSTW